MFLIGVLRIESIVNFDSAVKLSFDIFVLEISRITSAFSGNKFSSVRLVSLAFNT